MMIVDPRTLVIDNLATDAFISVNKKILRSFGGDGTLAIVLCEIISLYRYQKIAGRVDCLDAFPLPGVMLEKNLGLTSYKQQHAIERLQAAGLLISVIMGMPGCRWVTINFDAIAKLLAEEEQYQQRIAKTSEEFYEGLSVASREMDPVVRWSELTKAADNIQEPLLGAIKMASDHLHLTSSYITWTPEAIGGLKTVISYLRKERDRFDFSRLASVFFNCDSNPLHPWTATSLVKEMLKVWKQTPETTPTERYYTYRGKENA